MRSSLTSVIALVALGLSARYGVAQQTQAAPNPAGIDVGVAAPDFALAGATRYGALRDSVRLSDYHGKTVVLAFFYKARTKG